MSDDPEKPYSVGYRKPPRNRQFKPGRSGNPGGRPKKKRHVDIVGLLDEPIPVREGDKVRTMQPKEIVLHNLLKKALEEDNLQAIIHLLDQIEKHGALQLPPSALQGGACRHALRSRMAGHGPCRYRRRVRSLPLGRSVVAQPVGDRARDHRHALVGPGLFRGEQADMKRVRCAIYTRKSSDEGLEQDFNSLDAQREACEAYVASQAGEGWMASATRYDDGGLSGSTLERAALQALLADIERGGIDIMVVYRVDRLTRSLLDFAKLVEVFDTAQVSFVSVTQAFNTTNSMGRLTLNMLLSFAQFEREVTAERIRDKFAASKRKGMWMGGVPPLGYEPDGRSLKIVEPHAALVRRVFALYLELGTVRAVAEHLEAEGIRTPVRTMIGSGREFGGRSFSGGQIYRLLSNPIYIGEITSGEERWPGLHDAIINRKIWDRVQILRANNRHAHRTKTNARDPSLLAGLLFDADGEPLVATHATKGGRRYRYYASRSLQRGGKAGANGLRIPAREIEQLVCCRLAAMLEDPLKLAADLGASIDAAGFDKVSALGRERAMILRSTSDQQAIELVQTVIEKIIIEPECVNLKLRCRALAEMTGLGSDQQMTKGRKARTLSVSIPASLKRNGKTTRFILPGRKPANQRELDPTLVKALGRAHRWWNTLRDDTRLTVEDIAKQEGMTASYITRIMRLVFLDPAMTEAILRGKHPADMDLAKLTGFPPIPIEWAKQAAPRERKPDHVRLSSSSRQS